jgi:hypothetical protein
MPVERPYIEPFSDMLSEVDPAVTRWADAFLSREELDNLRDGITEGTIAPDPDFEIAAPDEVNLEETTSSNPARPRTLQAGYDPKKQTLIVVFRDGTWWSYHGVPNDLWQMFKTANSKGKFLRESGLDNWDNMGPTDPGSISKAQRVKIVENLKIRESLRQDN